MKLITPNLWFDGNAQEAAEYYISIFPDSKIISTMHYPKTKEEGLADFQLHLAGQVLVVEFELSGNRFVGINAGPEFKFTEAVSFSVPCKDQEEIDYYWGKLSSVPEAEQCGWCKDKFGLSWQVVPENVDELLKRPHGYANMMKMHKLEINQF